MEMLNLNYEKNQKLLLTCVHGQYEGIFVNSNEETGEIDLSNVVELGSGDSRTRLNFYVSEIKNIKILVPESSSENSGAEKHAKNLPTDLNGCTSGNIIDLNEVTSRPTTKKVFLNPIDENEKSHIEKMIKSFMLIYRLDSNFYSSIRILNECEEIGVFVTPATEGRFSRASLIAVSCSNHIFLFDLQELGDAVFLKGLKEILESETIKKIIYDCRLTSDCLFHKHLVKLNNVCDVEVEDILVRKIHHGVIRKHVRLLSMLLENYLGVQNVIPDLPSKTVLKDRPINNEVQTQIVTHVAYLILLHHRILNVYLKSQFFAASDLYCHSLRDSDITDYHTKKREVYTCYDELRALFTRKAQI